MLVVSHPTGNTFSKALLAQIVRENLEFKFFTTMNFSDTSLLLSCVPSSLKVELLRRSFPINRNCVKTRPFKEFIRLISRKYGINFLTSHETGYACVDAVYQDIDRYLDEYLQKANRVRSIKVVYCYEDGAFRTFSRAKEQGITCFYDLPIAYWETGLLLLKQEAERYPLWEPTLIGTRNSQAKLNRKTNELMLADFVVCPSKFVRDSLPHELVENKKVIVSEFGSPRLDLPHRNFKCLDKNIPLRVLFVGSMTQRKGLADIFAAFKLLNRPDIELVILGSLKASLEFYRQEYPNFKYYPPRPHSEVLQVMASCDIFLFPSIVEGRALVQQEAMISGLPLITTYNAGADDLIEEGVTGFLVPIRSPRSIAEKLAWFADNREAIPMMSSAAFERAKALTWESYSRKIISEIKKCL